MSTSLHVRTLSSTETAVDTPSDDQTPPALDAVTYLPCRVSRWQEKTLKHVKAAVPPGSMRAAHGLYQALPELRMDERLTTRTRPFQRRLLDFFEKLITMTDYTTMTVRVPWGGRTEKDARPGLAEWLGIHRSTVRNYVRLLREWGYLGTVAAGRSAEYVREKNAEGNELPVYVICIPSPLHAVPNESAIVDEICPPTAPLGGEPPRSKEFLTRTRAKSPEKGHGSAASHTSGAASGAPTASQPNRPVEHWPAHVTTKRRGQRWAAAAEIRHRCYALRPLSAKDLASVLKPWLKAGWTVSDVMNAIDRKPDGSLWPHDGAPVTRNTQRLRGWLHGRMESWTIDGHPMHSPDRRKAAQEAHNKVLRRIELDREMERLAEHAAYLAQGPSPLEIQSKAKIRSIFAENRRTKSSAGR